MKGLEDALGDEAIDLSEPVREMGAVYLEQIANLTEVIVRLAAELVVEEGSAIDPGDRSPRRKAKTDEALRRLCTIPGIGPVTAGTVAAFAPDLDTFESGRNFAAWLGPARPRAAAEIDSRQDEARRREQDGSGRHTPPADRGRHERDPSGGEEGRQPQPPARRPGGPDAEEGRGRDAGEQ